MGITDFLKSLGSSPTVTEVEAVANSIKNFVQNTLGINPQVQVTVVNGKPTINVQFSITL